MSNNPVNCWDTPQGQSAAKPISKGSEGSTTRVRSLTPKGQGGKTPRARDTHKGDDIVWAAWQHAEMVIKKAMITNRINVPVRDSTW